MTLVAPGVQGDVVTGTQGMGVSTPIAAAVAEATVGLDGDEHMPNVGMLAIGANAWMLAAGVSQVTGVPVGTTDKGAGATPKVHAIIAPVLTSGGITCDCTPAIRWLQ
jgi:hypothetical protein